MITFIRKLPIFLWHKLERLRLMMAMFFAQRVILGKTTFDEVPKALQKGCAEILIDSGLSELVPQEFGGTGNNN